MLTSLVLAAMLAGPGVHDRTSPGSAYRAPPVVFDGDTPVIDGEAVGPLRFYRHIGRFDLVEQYESNRFARSALMVTGGVLLVASGPTAYAAYIMWLMELGSGPGSSDPFNSAAGVVGVTAVLAGVAGLALAITGYAMDPIPVAPVELRSGPSRPELEWSLTPVVAPGGGGAGLSVDF